jgi:hypothetical protein
MVVALRRIPTAVGGGTPLLVGIVLLLLFLLLLLLLWRRYWSALHQRLAALHESLFFGAPKDPFRMIRITEENAEDTSNDDSFLLLQPHEGEKSSWHQRPRTDLLALNPAFVQEHSRGGGKSRWKLLSLGGYLSQLRPYMVAASKRSSKRNLPLLLLETEMQAALSRSLLAALGPHLGRMVLPSLGILDGAVHRAAGSVASMVLPAPAAASFGSTTSTDGGGGGIPLSLYSITYMAELNYQRLNSNNNHRKRGGGDDDDAAAASTTTNAHSPTPLELLRCGEVGYDHPFCNTTSESISSKKDASDGADASTTTMTATTIDTGPQQPMVPNPFTVAEHWEGALKRMQSLLERLDDGGWYDPHSNKMKEPTVIDERWLPGLHLGWGDATWSHTQQQILKNRLLAVLLNRLAANYCSTYNGEMFIVQMESGSKELFQPAEFIQALLDEGHTVETCIRSHVTTFGVGLVREGRRWELVQHPSGLLLPKRPFRCPRQRSVHVLPPHRLEFGDPRSALRQG